MEVVFKVPEDKVAKVKNVLEKDIISRGSSNLKKAKVLGFEESGNFLVYNSSEETCSELREGLKDLEGVNEVEEDKKEEVLTKVKEEEEEAMRGFGNIFKG